MTKDEMKDTVVQKQFEIIYENLAKLKKENKELNKKIRRYEEMLGSIFAGGNMIMQEKSKYDELRTM